MTHDEITKIVAPNGYAKGVWPNPFADSQAEWKRRKDNKKMRDIITHKIEMLMEPRFITPPETAECIEAIVTMTDSRRILEVGMCTGFTALHILRAIIGKPGAKLISIEPRTEFDADFWLQPDLISIFQRVDGWTPAILSTLHGQVFDLVFVDSDHSLDHTIAEVEALWPITRKGSIFLFHDMPEWQSPEDRKMPKVRMWLENQQHRLKGGCLPSCQQEDCLNAWGKDYPKQCNPGLGCFVRQ